MLRHHLLTLFKKNNNEFKFLTLALWTLIATYIFLQISKFLASLTHNDINLDLYLELIILKALYFFIIISAIPLFLHKRIHIKHLAAPPVIGVFLMLIFILLNKQPITPMFYAALIFSPLVFLTLGTNKLELPLNCVKAFKFLFWAIFFFTALPLIFFYTLHLMDQIIDSRVIDVLVDPYSHHGLFRGESFRGFMNDRTNYAFLSGLCILFVLTTTIDFRIKICSLLLLLLGLVMAESRGALLAIVVSALWFYRSKTAYIAIIAGTLLLGIYLASHSMRADFFGDPGGRVAIIWAYLEYINNHPMTLIFGNGGFHQYAYVDYFSAPIPSHNSILNSIMNFGTLVTALWFASLAQLWDKLYPAGRAVIVYIVIFGMFQNGFDAFYFSPENLIGLLVAIAFGSLTRWPEEKNRIKTGNKSETTN